MSKSLKNDTLKMKMQYSLTFGIKNVKKGVLKTSSFLVPLRSKNQISIHFNSDPARTSFNPIDL